MREQIIEKIFWQNTLAFKLFIWFLFLSLVPLIIFALQSYKNNSDKIKESALIELQHTSELQQRYLENWFSFRHSDILSWSQSLYSIRLLSNLNEGLKNSNKEVENFVKTPLYKKLVSQYEQDFIILKKNYNYIHDILLLDKIGNILYNITGEKILGSNLLTSHYSSTKLATAYKLTLKDKRTHFSDLEFYESSTNTMAGFLTSPISDMDGSFIGVLVVQIKLDNIFSVFTSKKGYSSYLVGDDGLLRTDISDAKRALNFEVNLNLQEHVEDQHEERHEHTYKKEVLSLHKNINIDGVKWTLVNEIEYNVLFENKKEFAISLLIFLFFLAIVIFIVAHYLSLQITKPVYSLIEAAELISKGNYTKKITIDTNDEIKQLADSFNLMTKKLYISQKEIKEQKDSYESLYQKSTDGILIIEDGKFIDCNESIVKMLHYHSKQRFLNTHPSKLSPAIQPDGKSSYEKANEMMALVFKNGSHSFEWVHKKADGKEFWVEVVLTKIVQNSKDIIHVVWRDIDKRKEVEFKLAELTKNLENRVQDEVSKNAMQQQQLFNQTRLAQMGEMISMIAHQWRQPLGAIAAVSIDMNMKLELGAYTLENQEDRIACIGYFGDGLRNIEGLTQSLTTTIDDFRDFYKPNKVSKKLNISRPIQKALNIVRSSLSIDNISLHESYDAKKELCVFDSELMQVILNIVKNAQDNFNIKDVEDALISIKTIDIEDGVRVEICDNGGGIEEKIIDKIFDPYFSTKYDKNGTGLGLYMSKLIIEDHHSGRLRAYNKDKGICFIIDILEVKEV